MAEDVKTTDNQADGTAPEPTVKTYSEEEYKALETKLENLKQSTKDNEDFKKKFEESEQARKDFEYKTKVGSFVKSLGLTDDIYEKYVTDIIVEKGLKFEGEKLIGGDDVVSVFKEKYPNAFKSEKPLPEFSVHSSGQEGAGTDEAFIRWINSKTTKTTNVFCFSCFLNNSSYNLTGTENTLHSFIIGKAINQLTSQEETVLVVAQQYSNNISG